MNSAKWNETTPDYPIVPELVHGPAWGPDCWWKQNYGRARAAWSQNRALLPSRMANMIGDTYVFAVEVAKANSAE